MSGEDLSVGLEGYVPALSKDGGSDEWTLQLFYDTD